MIESALFQKDYSRTSMEILTKKITNALDEQFKIKNPWILNSNGWPVENKKTIQDVIFLGDFLRKFLESGNWTSEKFRIWGIGTPTIKFFTDMVGLESRQISLISREYLFDNQTTKNNVHTSIISQDMHFVYAGRMSKSKRILTKIWAIYYLQKKLNIPIKMDFYGEFIDESKFCDCEKEIGYQKQALNLLKKLKWINRPKFHGKVTSQKWLIQEKTKPIYFSLSVLPFEDFSVSCAQAQESGWPCIVTKWGAHKDLSGAVLHLPLTLFESLEENPNQARAEGEIIADYIIHNKIRNIMAPNTAFVLPKEISSREMDHLRRRFLNKWGMGLQDIVRHHTADLKNNPAWNNFIREYIKCFN